METYESLKEEQFNLLKYINLTDNQDIRKFLYNIMKENVQKMLNIINESKRENSKEPS